MRHSFWLPWPPRSDRMVIKPTSSIFLIWLVSAPLVIPQMAGQLVHIHFFVFQQELENVDPQFRAQRLEQLNTFLQSFDMQHFGSSLS